MTGDGIIRAAITPPVSEGLVKNPFKLTIYDKAFNRKAGWVMPLRFTQLHGSTWLGRWRSRCPRQTPSWVC